MAYVNPAAIADLRRAYRQAGLAEQDLAPSWFEQLGRWLGHAVDADLPEPTAMTLATVDPDGRPSARTVLMKGYGPTGLTFFTNLTSRKATALDADPRAAAVLAWVALERQVCVTGDVQPLPREEVVAYAQSRPRGSQLSAWASHQSAVIAGRQVLVDRHGELAGRFGDGPIPVPPFWGGFRLVPLTVEFWQGRADRLHDRLRYRRQDGDWLVERLAP